MIDGHESHTIRSILATNTTFVGNSMRDDLIRSMLAALARKPYPRWCIVPPNVELRKTQP